MAHGSFVWYELSTTNLDGAVDFYSRIVGWQPKDAAMPGMDYRLFQMGEVPIAGVMHHPDALLEAGVPPVWFGYVGVKDVDAAAKKAEALGGSIEQPPTDIPGIGRFAVIKDPHGAIISLFYSDSPPPESPFGQAPGRIGWNELYAGDLDGAWAFYSALFGWTKGEAMDMGDMGIYQLFEHEGNAIGGMMKKPDGVPQPAWLYYFNVPNLTAAMKALEAAGGKILSGPMEVPGGDHIAQASDPQGGAFALVGKLG
ncbi:VOC family protein [Rhizobium sp. KVB221]|uniref:VOC family protein n=1 Tax=Rhizobium setariae TaxID=2801340 RepID=A0A936YPQ9_9HYPH|nr:VOC family protein [Rhizobium setariae]MBL0374443.1 VOC family protein [Rhizobium setariae]